MSLWRKIVPESTSMFHIFGENNTHLADHMFTCHSVKHAKHVLILRYIVKRGQLLSIYAMFV